MVRLARMSQLAWISVTTARARRLSQEVFSSSKSPLAILASRSSPRRPLYNLNLRVEISGNSGSKPSKCRQLSPIKFHLLKSKRIRSRNRRGKHEIQIPHSLRYQNSCRSMSFLSERRSTRLVKFTNVTQLILSL